MSQILMIFGENKVLGYLTPEKKIEPCRVSGCHGNQDRHIVAPVVDLAACNLGQIGQVYDSCSTINYFRNVNLTGQVIRVNHLLLHPWLIFTL